MAKYFLKYRNHCYYILKGGTIVQNQITSKSHLEDPGGTLDIESLSISLNVTSLSFTKVSLVQFTGTKTTKASAVMGTKIFKLHEKNTWYINYISNIGCTLFPAVYVFKNC